MLKFLTTEACTVQLISNKTYAIILNMDRLKTKGEASEIESPHVEIISKERYLGAWMSVNDIQVQAGEEKFNKIMAMIENEISSLDRIEVPYKSRAWTVQSIG